VADDEIDPALADLCRREHHRLVGLLALYVGDVPTAEDLAQEAFVRLHQHWPRVRTMSSPRGWLSTVGVNLARSWWRRHFAQQRAQRRLAARPELAADQEPADVLAMRAAVSALPHRQRAALVLRYYAGLSITETARQLHCAEGTVKSLTHRAIATLRGSFAMDEIDDADDADEIPHHEVAPEEVPHVWHVA
jgi:RNA polymerase sigma-70 factor (sigma-E family)